MTNSAQSTGRIKGHDAMHRARILNTHPTHACSEQFRRSSGMPMARPAWGLVENDASAPMLKRAQSALRRWPC